jgi:hypothetical protein
MPETQTHMLIGIILITLINLAYAFMVSYVLIRLPRLQSISLFYTLKEGMNERSRIRLAIHFIFSQFLQVQVVFICIILTVVMDSVYLWGFILGFQAIVLSVTLLQAYQFTFHNYSSFLYSVNVFIVALYCFYSHFFPFND